MRFTDRMTSPGRTPRRADPLFGSTSVITAPDCPVGICRRRATVAVRSCSVSPKPAPLIFRHRLVAVVAALRPVLLRVEVELVDRDGQRPRLLVAQDLHRDLRCPASWR